MTENEKSAVKYFENEMYKAQNNMLKILRNKSRMTNNEFSRKMRTELIRYDNCKDMRDYYNVDCIILEEAHDVSN